VLYYPTPEAAREASSSVSATPPADVAAVPLATARDVSYLAQRHILVPVAGADMTKVEDSFNEGRDGGERTHRAIDILAPRGTPILSADDGRFFA
jgi:murein DD-endopeptidase MepM/ murein hydrolase activator NlpD